MSTLATTNIKHPSSASNNIVLDSSGNVVLQAGSASTPALQPSGDTNTGIFFPAADTIAFAEGGVESVRIDSSSRLLVGTSTGISNYYIGGLDGWTASFQVARSEGQGLATFTNWSTQTSYGAEIFLAKSQSGTIGSHAVPSSGSVIGRINFNGSDGTNFRSAATISAEADGTFSNADSPGRLVFSTTSDGSSSPTERMRITNDGAVLAGKTGSNPSVTGTELLSDGNVRFVKSAGNVVYVNRLSDDGDLITFAQANATEGTISVSGTTVSYNGAHLSRWSQLPSGAVREEILRGTVLSNIDEMCSWGEEDNEQLNRMKVSDVEGDPNVSGVFQAWDDDDDTYTDDFYCAMTGDFIIRVAEGIPVHRGQLLMSAGDGTAKPQDDDIIRSKTIAKVTSNHVTCTYDDGSYCVPCVLMAC